MGVKNYSEYTKSDRYCKIVTVDYIPYFTMYKYKTPDSVDFENVIEQGKNIEGRLFEVYSKEKEYEGKKYTIYCFIFEDKDGIFNISISEKYMQAWVNKLIDCDLSKNVEIGVFDTISESNGKIYRNFAFRQEGQLLNNKISSEEKWSLVKEITNAAGKVTKDFSLISDIFIKMFEELKEKLEKNARGLVAEDLEVDYNPDLDEKLNKTDNEDKEEDLPF